MKFKTRQLRLEHITGFDAEIEPGADVFEQVEEGMIAFKQFLVANGCYFDGPVVYKYNPFDESGEFLLFVPIGNEIEVNEEEFPFFFQQEFNLTTDYYYRHYDQDEPIPYEGIKQAVESNNCSLMTIYHVVLDLYGDQVLDLYCEVSKNL